MALWDENSIKDINEGSGENTGDGDSIRAAFFKVDYNFANISNFLSSPTVGFLNANVTTNLSSNYATFANTYTANTTGATANFTSNVTAGNLIANSGIYSSGVTTLTGATTVGDITVDGTLSLIGSNVSVGSHMIPTANLTYDLGDSSHFFRNIYAQGLVQVNTVTASSDAGLLQLHANLSPGDVKDVGIFGKFYNGSSNSFAFFGHQQTTSNFVYKITPTDVTTGNSVVYDGVYGNVQFGSLFLSNVSNGSNGNVLIVGGGANFQSANVYAPSFNGNLVGTMANVGRLQVTGTVAGTLTVDGNVYSNGYQVLTTGTGGLTAYTGSVIPTLVVTSTAPSTSPLTGALILTGTNGGLGVAGNVYSGTGFYGNITGNILTAAQPYITSVGSLNGLTITSGYSISTPDLQATTLGVTSITASTLNVTGSLNGLTSLTLNGNVTSNTAGFVGSLYGTVQTAAQSKITSLGALTTLAVDGATRLGVTVANSFSTANAVVSGGYITGLANIAATNSTATTAVVTNFSSGNAQITSGNATGLTNITATNSTATTAVATNFSSGNAVISGGYITGLSNLTATNSTTTTAVATNFSSGNVVITGGSIAGISLSGITTFVTTNFSSGNAVISGGYITGLANIAATQATITNFGTGNAQITSGNVTGLTNLASTTSVATNFSSGNAQITSGNVTGLTNLSSSNAVISGGYISGLANVAATTGYIGTVTANTVNAATIGNSGATLTGTIQTAAQTNITSVGTLTGLVVNNNTVNSNVSITAAGNIVMSANTTAGSGIFVTGNILPSANLAYNVGSATQWFNTFYGKSVQAQYADLAEKYLADADYEVGTVVAVGGAAEVTASKWGDLAIGVVSDNPAYMMNSGLDGGTYIALKGRVPVKVIGAITKGQRLIAGDNGCAVAAVPHASDVFGVALESNSEVGVKLIEAVIL